MDTVITTQDCVCVTRDSLVSLNFYNTSIFAVQHFSECVIFLHVFLFSPKSIVFNCTVSPLSFTFVNWFQVGNFLS